MKQIIINDKNKNTKILNIPQLKNPLNIARRRRRRLAERRKHFNRQPVECAYLRY